MLRHQELQEAQEPAHEVLSIVLRPVDGRGSVVGTAGESGEIVALLLQEILYRLTLITCSLLAKRIQQPQ